MRPCGRGGRLEVVELLTRRGEKDGPAGDFADGSAAPPRASPSSLVRTTPVKPDSVRNALALHRILADHRVEDEQNSSGSTALRSRRPAASARRRCCSRPAVSTMTTSYWLESRRTSAPRGDLVTGPTEAPGSAANTGTPACSPTTWSWSTASGAGGRPPPVPGRVRRSWARKSRACRRVSSCRNPEAGEHDRRRRFFANCESSGPGRRGSPTSSSLTILTTCWAGFRPPETVRDLGHVPDPLR